MELTRVLEESFTCLPGVCEVGTCRQEEEPTWAWHGGVVKVELGLEHSKAWGPRVQPYPCTKQQKLGGGKLLGSDPHLAAFPGQLALLSGDSCPWVSSSSLGLRPRDSYPGPCQAGVYPGPTG